MAISKIGGSSSDNWELISSVTPTASSAAVNFTGLSVYRKLLIRWTGLTLNTSSTVVLRLNNDSGTNYTYQANSGVSIAATSWSFNSSGSTAPQGYAIITDCDTTSIKILENGAGTPNPELKVQGLYMATALITQVNLVTASTFAATGTVALYGVK